MVVLLLIQICFSGIALAELAAGAVRNGVWTILVIQRVTAIEILTDQKVPLDPGSSTPSQLLFLPGALGNGQFWAPVMQVLSHPAEKVLVTYPGFAGEPQDASISCFEDLIHSMVARVDRPTALIAQSMGGVIAIELAFRKRDLITHLVLAATSGGLDTAKLGAVDWRPEFRKHNPELPDWMSSYSSDLTTQLSSIEAPVLLIWGDCDPLSPVAVGRALLQRLPNAHLHVIPGGEHDIAQRRPDLIAPLIDAHLLRESIRNVRGKGGTFLSRGVIGRLTKVIMAVKHSPEQPDDSRRAADHLQSACSQAHTGFPDGVFVSGFILSPVIFKTKACISSLMSGMVTATPVASCL